VSPLIVVWDNEEEVPNSLLSYVQFHQWIGPVKPNEVKDLPQLPQLIFYRAPHGPIDWWQWTRAASRFEHVEMALWVLNNQAPMIQLDSKGHISEAGIFPSHTRDGFLPSGIVYLRNKQSVAKEKIFIPTMESKRKPIAISEYRGAILLDRDGVLNQDRGYVFRDKDLQWEELGVRLIATAKQHDLDVHVLTNQSGIGRGYYREEEVQVLHLQMNDLLSARGLAVDSWSFCPYHPKGVDPYLFNSLLRKPGPGMLLELLANWPLDPLHLLMVGDKASDRLHYPGLPVFLIHRQYNVDSVDAFTFEDENELINHLELFLENL